MRKLWTLAAVAVLAVAGCGDDDEGEASGSTGGSASGSGELVVSAATSLKKAFTAYGDEFSDATVKLQFAGSDELAAQIKQGVKPDVFASANTKLPEELFAAGLVEKPTVFAGNRLVLAVPADGTKVKSLADAGKPGVTVAMGAEGVPIGDYTRKVLAKLPAAESKAILGNVRSEEPDVGGIVGKLTQGAVDAGFVYVTDVVGTDGKLKAIELPKDLQPSVAYGVAVVKGAKNPDAAKAFIDGLVNGAGAQQLEQAGFEPPPAS
jgi:molybdate transport system substrate-binding protein